MRNIKLRRALGTVCFLLVFLLLQQTLCLFRAETQREGFLRVMMRELEAENEAYGTVFVGSSLVFSGVNPAVTDEVLGHPTFCAATNAARYIDSYYLLQELYQHQSPDTVVLEISLRRTVGSLTVEGGRYLYDALEPSPRKLGFFFRRFEPVNWLYILLPSVRTSENLGEVFGLENAAHRLSEGFREGDPASIPVGEGRNYYKGHQMKGSRYARGGIGELVRDFEGSQDRMADDSLYWLEKCVALCREKGSDVVLFTPPSPWAAAAEFQDDSAFTLGVRQFAAEQGCDYYDFQLLKNEIWQRPENEFNDNAHLSSEGADAFSALLGDLLLQRQAGTLQPADWFYESYSSLRRETPFIYNAWIVRDPVDKMLYAQATCGSGAIPQYQAWAAPGTVEAANEAAIATPYGEMPEGYTLLRDWDTDPILDEPQLPEGDWVLRVNVRPTGSEGSWQQFALLQYEPPQ